jgi:dihydrolipoamide dehydrogenase
MEFAHVMNSFGVDVTVVEMLDRILPIEDAETVAVLEKDFSKRGIKILTGTKASGMEKTKQEISLKLTGKDGAETTAKAEMVLVAVGRSPNTEGLGLEAIGVEIERGFVKAGDYYETAVAGVYAVGDIVPTPLLAHVASKEGEIAVEHIAGRSPEPRIPADEIPSAVYCEPQIGSFGLTEEAAKKAGRKFEKAIFPYRGVGKAVAVESPEGIVKIIFDPESREILGAHAAGNSATEIIHEILLAKKAELLLSDIAEMIHAHPTISEGVMEAARAAEGWAIHI